MRNSFIAFTALLCLAYKGQTQVNLPELLPPSPDVAALMKGGELSTSPHTGTANASLPIYELKVKGFSLPISINYSSNGFKPGEIPSRTGIGWSLNAGGVVSRIKRGKPDDYCTTPTPKTISELLQYDAAALSYLNDLEDPATYHDAEPDEYRYSVNGISGKFIIKRDGSVLQLPYNNVKIVVVKNAGVVDYIHITDDNGIRYTFGYSNVIEKTLEHNLINNFIQKQEINTAWMLTRILLPTGEYIDFNYNSINHRAFTGISESATIAYAYDELCGITPEPACATSLAYTSKINNVKYRSYYLASIAASTGPSVSFGYEDRPDTSGDNRLKTIVVYPRGGGTAVRSVELEYQNAAGSTPSSEVNAKFFLKKVIVKDPTGGSAPSQEYLLGYVNDGTEWETPAGEDHLGFATDGTSSTPMPELTETEQIFAAYIAPKHPNGEISKIGMLQKITYPTGGWDEFYYEPNMSSTWDSVNKKNLVSARAMGVGSGTGPDYAEYTTNFTPTRNMTGTEVHFNVSWMGSPPIPDEYPTNISAIMKLTNNTTSTVVLTKTARGFAGGSNYTVDGATSVNLVAGNSYTLYLQVRNSTDALGRADVIYDNATGKEWKNIKEELCGVRVRKVVNHDPVSNKSISKFYKYEKLGDSVTISAEKLYYPQYLSQNATALACTGGHLQKVCFSHVWSNNSVATTQINDAAGVVYKWVIESDDSTFANGGIEHTFMTEGVLNGAAVMGSDIPDRPTDPYTYRNGLTTQQVYFNHSKEVVKKINHYYSLDERIDNIQLYNYMIRKKYTPLITYSPVSELSFNHFDVMQYSIGTAWNHLDSTIVREYDLVNSKVMVSKTAYTYGSTDNINATEVATKGSDNIELRTEMKYPNDFPLVDVYESMIERNMIAPVVEEESYKDSKLLYKTVTEYKDWFNDEEIIAPELIKKQKSSSGTLETRIRYHQYNTAGTPLEVSKENDMRVSYIWDYNGQLPIAEITNGTYGSGVAYTSFEADGKGGWTFSGTPATEGTERSGTKSYSVALGNITYAGSLTTDAKYWVSFWGKSASGVTVNSSSPASYLTKDGWTLYKILLTYSGSGGITITGSGYIDELRLHPELAIVKTFTYKPEIGITSTGDNSSIIQRYEYDVFNRLLRIRDMDNNILKQMEYKYGESITPCANTSANWTATGTYRCVKTNAWGNNNSGVREREEKDLNNCSSTYNTTRWVSEGTSVLCPTVSNCTAADKRVVGGVCETGCKVLVRSIYNGSLNWTCIFRYEWSDGYKGPEFSEGSTYNCAGGVCD